MIDLVHFTQGEKAILRLLADGKYHTAEDIGIRCDRSTHPGTMKARIWYIKQKLKRHSDGIDIETRLENFVVLYRLIKPVTIEDAFFRFCPRVNRL